MEALVEQMEKLEKYTIISLFARRYIDSRGFDEGSLLVTTLAEWNDVLAHNIEVHLGNLDARDFINLLSRDAKSLLGTWLQDEYDEKESPLRSSVAAKDPNTEDRQLNVLKTWLESKDEELKKESLGTYFQDGKKLLKLLQKCSGADLPEEHTAKKVKRNNVERSFAFLRERKFNFGLIRTEDIMSGNIDQTINLLWKIYDFFVIGSSFPEVSSGQIGLLQWWQLKTYGYQYVKILDFLKSFQDGLAFLAVMHHYRPDLINCRNFSPQTPVKNLKYAFDTAEVNLGIPRLFDAEELLSPTPGFESVVMRYAAQFFLYFEESRKFRSDNLLTLKDKGKNYIYCVPENMCSLCQHQVGSCEELCQHMEAHFGFNQGLWGVDDIILNLHTNLLSEYRCYKCPATATYETEGLLLQHEKERHGKNLSCKYRHCPHVTEYKNALTIHQNKHKGHSACPRCSGLVKEQ